MTRLELAASTTPIVKNGIHFSLSWIILLYRLIFVGFVVFLSDIVLPEKYTSVHNIEGMNQNYAPKRYVLNVSWGFRIVYIISHF